MLWLQESATTGVGDAGWEEEGLRLALQRREEMRELIRTDPAAAVASALPDSVRRRLPASIQEVLEEPINAIGELAVYCKMDEDEGAKTFRVARIAGGEFQAFVYGRRSEESSRSRAYLVGVAVDDQMAVSDERLQVVAADELLVAGAPPVCASGGHELGGAEPLGILAGGSPYLVCNDAHLDRFREELQQAEEASSGGVGFAGGADGNGRVILMRVDFSDLEGEPFSLARGQALISEVNDFYLDGSYGRAGFALAGAGSEVTTVLRMPNTAAYYGGNDRYNELRVHARAAATEAGYVLSDYEYDVTCMGRVLGFDWAGLGYVQGTGAWIRNSSSAGVTAHELGHNMGLNHANFWDTGGESVAGAGESVEYGDIFDTMGSASGGVKQFNARYKNLLSWIRVDEFADVSVSGVYRIFPLDDPAPGGLRALKVAKDASRNYWVEFRQRIPSNPWLMNGAGLRQAGNGNQRSNLLDTTPGSADGRDDSALVIGRTFSDHGNGVHITPIGFGSTVPQSLDVMVQLGDFEGNRPPSLALSASRTTVAPGQWLELTAVGSDPDGDPLAYYWDFGGGEFGTNGPAAAHRWFSHGERVVRCVASDQKGGRSTDSLLITVGTPTQFRISGRVASAGRPLEGVRVYASSSVVTYTDSQGRYSLVNLPSGNYTVAASMEGQKTVPLGFVNPVSVGPSRGNVDFVVADPAAPFQVELILAGSVWRYLSSRTNLDSGWRSLDYLDGDWEAGPAQLGYGDDDEATVLDFGPDPANKPITTYFRREFMVEDPGDFSLLELGLLRDDGAIVYVNEQEVFRSNMPEGTPTATTLASSTVGGRDELQFFAAQFGSNLLRPGANILAVEVHQANPSSSDFSFDLTLRGFIANSELVSTGAVWKYWASGTHDPGWFGTGFDDSSWPAGAGQLGYGDGDEVTVLEYGMNPNTKPVTVYFRHEFFVPSETRVGTLRLGLLRDDGAVVYLNGEEILRSNLPQTQIQPSTLALVAVSGAEEDSFLEIAVDAAKLNSGLNLVAVEVHQVSAASADLSFDLHLTSSAVRELRGTVRVVSPVHQSQWPLGSNITLRVETSAKYGDEIDTITFYDGNQYLGETREQPYQWVWHQPAPGWHEVRAVATSLSGEVLVALPVGLTVEPPVMPVDLMVAGATWHYLDSGVEPEPGWRTLGFDDSSWGWGPARLGYGGDGEVTVVGYGNDAANKHITTYFRTRFDLDDANLLKGLLLRLQRDDGAVVYLNGFEVMRSNMPEQTIGPNTLAASVVGGASEFEWFETQLASDWVVSGPNVVAVEVHQASANSSDLGFDLQLIALAIPQELPLLVRWERLSDNRLRLSWPTWMEGEMHITSEVTGNAAWEAVEQVPEVTDGIRSLIVEPNGLPRFYQLRR